MGAPFAGCPMSALHDVDEIAKHAHQVVEQFLLTVKNERIYPRTLDLRQQLRMELFPMVSQYFLKDRSIPSSVLADVLTQSIKDQSGNYIVDQMCGPYSVMLKQRIDELAGDGKGTWMTQIVAALKLDGQSINVSEVQQELQSSAWHYFLYDKKCEVLFLGGNLHVTSDSHNRDVVFNVIQPIVVDFIHEIGFAPFKDLLRICIVQSQRYVECMEQALSQHPSPPAEQVVDIEGAQEKGDVVDIHPTLRKSARVSV